MWVWHLWEEKGNEEVGRESLSCSQAMGKSWANLSLGNPKSTGLVIRRTCCLRQCWEQPRRWPQCLGSGEKLDSPCSKFSWRRLFPWHHRSQSKWPWEGSRNLDTQSKLFSSLYVALTETERRKHFSRQAKPGKEAMYSGISTKSNHRNQ